MNSGFHLSARVLLEPYYSLYPIQLIYQTSLYPDLLILFCLKAIEEAWTISSDSFLYSDYWLPSNWNCARADSNCFDLELLNHRY